MNRYLLISLLLSTLCFHLQAQSPKYEMRGAWIATVKNIDWPSRAGLHAEFQQAEFIELLDTFVAHKLNAVIVQVRPAGDAFYPSPYEPWSEWLSGQQGARPEPYYDPLAFMIEESHQRGLEFHAWINPFRATTDYDSSKVLHPKHILSRHPEWAVKYGRNAYLDPGVPAAREYVSKIISDLARRYPIDALHFDDYFYPYQIQGQEFPDETSFLWYGNGWTNKADWRRNNTTEFIRIVRDSLLRINPEIQFGISPFGVWRNQDMDAKGSPTRAGQTSYDHLYADILLWIQKGMIDYVAPQIYFSIGYPPADFMKLLEWWRVHAEGKRLYIGLAPYKLGNNHDNRWDNPDQLDRQIELTRLFNEINGVMFFSAKWFKKNPLGFADRLKADAYALPALVPPIRWVDDTPPQAPDESSIRTVGKGLKLSWLAADSTEQVNRYIIYKKAGKDLPPTDPAYIWKIVRSDELEVIDYDTRFLKKYSYRVTAVDRFHNEGESVVLQKVRWSWGKKK